MISTVFLGTPAPSVPSLLELSASTDVRLVVTRPDQPRGRSRKPQPSPVKVAALELGLPVAQPPDRRNLLSTLAKSAPYDIGVVIAFGMILRPEVLAIPRKGFVNIHFSLLPRWRGAAPVERAVLGGDSETGVTLMAMDEGLDTGPVINKNNTSISPDETSGELLEKLTLMGAVLLRDNLSTYVNGSLIGSPQTVQGVTYAKKIEAAEARLSLAASSEIIHRQINGFNPRPGAFCELDGRRFKIWRAMQSSEDSLSVGELGIINDSLLLGVGDSALQLLEVQAEGSRRMTGMEWARGRKTPLGRLA